MDNIHQTVSPLVFLFGALLLMAVAFGVILFELKNVGTDTAGFPKIGGKDLTAVFLPKPATPSATPVPVSGSYMLPILLYHYVENVKDANDTTRIKLDITPSVLEKQIQTLRDAGYRFLSLSDISRIIGKKEPVPDKGVALTFDDGYRDFYTDVFPLVKKYGIHVTVFVITGFIGKPNYMTEEQIRNVLASNLVEMGDHTATHRSLKGASQQVLEAEIVRSRQQFADTYGVTMTSFAYPYGAFDWNAVEAVRSTGFTGVATTIQGNSVSMENQYTLPRIRPGQRTGKALLEFITNQGR